MTDSGCELDSLPKASPEEAANSKPVESGLESTRSPYTHFARKKTLKRADGKLHGNWFPDFAGACQHTRIAFIEEGSILSLEDVGKCSNGYAIVKCSHY